MNDEVRAMLLAAGLAPGSSEVATWCAHLLGFCHTVKTGERTFSASDVQRWFEDSTIDGFGLDSNVLTNVRETVTSLNNWAEIADEIVRAAELTSLENLYGEQLVELADGRPHFFPDRQGGWFSQRWDANANAWVQSVPETPAGDAPLPPAAPAGGFSSLTLRDQLRVKMVRMGIVPEDIWAEIIDEHPEYVGLPPEQIAVAMEKAYSQLER